MNSYEFLKYLTVNITAKSLRKESAEATATAFYVRLKNTTLLVTAKHFAANTESIVQVPVHYKENNTIVTIPVTAPVEWTASEEYDIAFCDINPIVQKFKAITVKEMHYSVIPEKDIITRAEFNKIPILSEVLTLGYPSSYYSTHHQWPLFKLGRISSLPSDFAEDGEGFLDLYAETGCSGSPIILNNSELKLIGILVKGTSKKTGTTSYVSADKLLEMSENCAKK